MKSFKIVFGLLILSVVFSSCAPSPKEFIDNKISVALVYGEEISEIADAEFNSDSYSLQQYNTLSDAVAAVENGVEDLTVVDRFNLKILRHNERSIAVKKQAEFSIDYCAYFNKENEKLKNAFNAALEELDSEGVLEAIENSFVENGCYEAQSIEADDELVMLCSPYFDDRIYFDENGRVNGIDYEIAKAVCARMGYGLRLKICEFDEMFIRLEKGEGDFVLGGTEYRREREQYYLASHPYYSVEYFIVERGKGE